MEIAQDPPVWLVTGCSTGFGRSITAHLLEKGLRVVVTARRTGQVRDLSDHDNAFAVALDVTDEGSVADAVGRAEEHFGRIDVVVKRRSRSRTTPGPPTPPAALTTTPSASKPETPTARPAPCSGLLPLLNRPTTCYSVPRPMTWPPPSSGPAPRISRHGRTSPAVLISPRVRNVPRHVP
ncbi:SDR family NAD(P)-dependent oxidoreductase [Streptomyces sp. NPDC000134]|uniref:SDR family NAD(P)-dependent oxidoreductase n=1 Tax=Streptomyces sp. NPDC000134 TaxID=3364536 RepID=UPI0036C48BFD